MKATKIYSFLVDQLLIHKVQTIVMVTPRRIFTCEAQQLAVGKGRQLGEVAERGNNLIL